MSITIRRKCLIGLLVLSVVAVTTITILAIGTRNSAESIPLQDTASLYGNWTGESICQVKESACHDEKALYIIAKSDTPDKVSITADKIVDGKPVVMGTMDFSYDPKTGVLFAEYKYGVWKLTVKGNKIEGTLTTPDKVVFRRVTLTKQP
jgi:hypothetical protein